MEDLRPPAPRARLAAVILAAGASARMGAPKALIEWRGRSAIRRLIELADAAGLAPILAVSGAVRLPADQLPPALEVFHPTWHEGQLSSLQAGLAALPPVSGALVLTVDRPHLRLATLEALALAHRADPAAIWQPAYRGRRGHPILYPSAALRELAALPAGPGPRAWLAACAHPRRHLELDDPAIHDNLDTPAERARLLREEAHSGDEP